MSEEICGELVSRCVCKLDKGHTDFHECEDPICNGSWKVDDSGNFIVSRYPGNLLE